MKVPSTISRTPPFPIAGSSPEGLDLQVYVSEQPFVTFGVVEAKSFGPKVLEFALALQGSYPLPSAFGR